MLIMGSGAHDRADDIVAQHILEMFTTHLNVYFP